VARRATLIQQTKSASANFLLLDAGNSLISDNASATEPAQRTKAQTSIDIINRMGYDAVAIGDMDATLLTRDELAKRISEAKAVSFVSANLIDKSTGKLFAKPYVIKQVGGHRIALIGITAMLPETTKDFSTTIPLDAARDTVRKAQSQADIIIVLSSAGAELNKMIAEQVPGVDLVFSGGQNQLDAPASPIPGTLVMQADLSNPGHAGRVVGKLDAEFDREGKLTKQNWSAVQLGPEIADDPDMSAWSKLVPTAAPTPAQ
jgi:2',3'-cyclic-nucleotide 2'-phosphodiesterase (5'-nucleotidase family)